MNEPHILTLLQDSASETEQVSTANKPSKGFAEERADKRDLSTEPAHLEQTS
jgi:hypothetical protein